MDAEGKYTASLDGNYVSYRAFVDNSEVLNTISSSPPLSWLSLCVVFVFLVSEGKDIMKEKEWHELTASFAVLLGKDKDIPLCGGLICFCTGSHLEGCGSLGK